MSGQGTIGTEHDRRIADRYRLTGVIGSGGGGTVWTAVDEVLGREVAVKDIVVPPWLGDSERELARERTLREARAACRIDHPNVVGIYDVVEEDGRPWIIMRLVRAPSLAQVIEQDGPCSPQRAARIGLQVLGALQAAHAHGITHRDVKPSNVLVEGDRAVLTDFGIATIDGESTLTSPDALIGAPSYIAPERVKGAPATAASDLWSLGATLYAAVEGRPPHQREGIIAILTAVATEEPDPPRRAGALGPLINALLVRDPLHRPPAADVELFLKRIISLTDADDDAMNAVTTAAANAALATAITTAAAGAVTTAGGFAIERTTRTDRPVPGGSPDERTVLTERPTNRRRRIVPVIAAASVVVAAVLLGVLSSLPRDLTENPVLERLPIGGAPQNTPASTTTVESGPNRGGDQRGVRNRPGTTNDPAERASSVQPVGDPALPPSVVVPQPSQQPTTAEPTTTGQPTTTTTTDTVVPPPTTEDTVPTTAESSATA